MSFNKKDEDDGAIVKVDRTSVFQEGVFDMRRIHHDQLVLTSNSSHIQLIANLSKTMPHTIDEDRTSPLYRRKVPDK